MRERSVQQNLYTRSSDFLPFVDELAVKQAVSAVARGLEHAGKGEGEVIFPFSLTRAEQERVRNHKSGIGIRVGYMVEVPLEEGVGTVIQIRERQEKKRSRYK